MPELQQRLRAPCVGDERSVAQRREIRAICSQGDRLRLLLVDLRERGRGHHPAEVLDDLGREIRPLVARIGLVRRHVGVIAEERQVELLDGDGRVAHALHPHVGEVDVHVRTEEAARRRRLVGELLDAARALAHVTVAPSEADPVLPRELLAERARRGRQHLARVGARVVGPSLARWPVRDPAVVHRCPPRRACDVSVRLQRKLTHRLVCSTTDVRRRSHVDE
jgi:hypothetical protein